MLAFFESSCLYLPESLRVALRRRVGAAWSSFFSSSIIPWGASKVWVVRSLTTAMVQIPSLKHIRFTSFPGLKEKEILGDSYFFLFVEVSSPLLGQGGTNLMTIDCSEVIDAG